MTTTTRRFSDDTLIAASKDQVFADVGGEMVILNSKTGVYYGLDSVGCRLWTLIQEPKTVLQLQQTLLNEFEVAEEQCRTDLEQLIHELEQNALVEIGPS